MDYLAFMGSDNKKQEMSIKELVKIFVDKMRIVDS